MSNISIAIQLENDTQQRLLALSASKNHELHWLIEQAILEYIEKEEARIKQKIQDKST